ncbi:MAG TPA: SulP family inorganic anion transporter [Gaiellaceae bacterium]|nr:SulP family inorganic anion transporter [Gaiellaceae bacterium]
MRILPDWLAHYRRAWLGHDIGAGLIVWGVVVPQAVAYAQIAGLPPSAGLVAAPAALVVYAILGSSRTLVVSATTATSALSAAAVAPLAHGDPKRFAALSAALAIVTGVVLIAAGLLRIGGVMDLVSKPVMTGFLFGLGLFVAVGQLPKLFGIRDGHGNFFPRLLDFFRHLHDTNGWTLATGVVSIAALLLLMRLAPQVPATLVVLVGSIVLSSLLDLSSHGVDVVGTLPRAFPHPAIPDVGWHDLVELLAPAFGVMILSAEAIGVARTLGGQDGYRVAVNHDLIALGGSNALAGLSPGFVQSGGASQTMANERAGGKTQFATIVAAALILLTGAFFTGLFKNLPETTLAAIVIVAISGFWKVSELRRLAGLRTSAIAFAMTALVGVLLLGVLPGLLLAAALSLVLVIKKLSRPTIGILARDSASGVWGNTDRHPGWAPSTSAVVVRVEGPLFYANVTAVKERILDLVDAADPRPPAVVLDLSNNAELDVQTVDTLSELASALGRDHVALRVSGVHAQALELLERAKLTDRIGIFPTLDAAAKG